MMVLRKAVFFLFIIYVKSSVPYDPCQKQGFRCGLPVGLFRNGKSLLVEFIQYLEDCEIIVAENGLNREFVSKKQRNISKKQANLLTCSPIGDILTSRSPVYRLGVTAKEENLSPVWGRCFFERNGAPFFFPFL